MSELTLPGYGESQWLESGCTGDLYRCRRDDGSEVAVRKLNALAIDRDRLRRNFRRHREAPPHEGVARLVEFQVDESPYFAAREWVEGGSPLSEVEVPEDESEAWAILGELAEGLAHLHRYGIHHGNLHPGKVFLSKPAESGHRVRVIDAGPGPGGKVHFLDLDGNAWFAPPEQLEHPEEWDDGKAERWDVYRFGALAFAWLNGRLPRGLRYLESLQAAIEEGGGRPVPIDGAILADDLCRSPGYAWSDGDGPVTRETRLRREIIDRCLAIDPADRPVDMREVVAAFEALEVRFSRERTEAKVQATIEEAEARVRAEKRRQARKLGQTRLTAAMLLASLIVTALFLVRFRERSRGYENRASDLAQVVRHQKSQLEDFDRRWSQTQHDLRTTREAADSVFAQVGQANVATADSLPAEGSLEYENLEKSREFLLKAIAEAADDPARELERVRNLQHLAHVEIRLDRKVEAQQRFEEAIPQFEALLEARAAEISVVQDIESRLADCHETMARLIDADPSEEMRRALAGAARYLERLTARRPDDADLNRRRLSIDFRLARQLHEHRRFEEALAGYVALGERIEVMRTGEPDSLSISEMVGEVQFHTALTLRELGREPESVRAYLAALETFTSLGSGRSQTDEECLRLARLYTDLGELFLAADSVSADEVEELLNEALRLVSPVAFRRPDHLETAILFARTTARIGALERDSGRWTDGYRSSLAGIEQLEAALEQAPGDLDGRLTLVELRAGHTELLKYQESIARKCLGKGIEMAHQLQDEIESRDAKWPRGVCEGARIRLVRVFQTYGELSRQLGDVEQAEACFERAHRARALLVHREDQVGEGDAVAF